MLNRIILIWNNKFPAFLIPRSPTSGVYFTQLYRSASVCSNVNDINNRNIFLTAMLLKKSYQFHKIIKAFSRFYHQHLEFVI